MPHNPINYANTIMYKIVCNNLNIPDMYIGHTTNFKTRKNQHKNCCNNKSQTNYFLNIYQFIRDNGGWNNWTMIKIEDYPCNSLLDATKRERELLEEFKPNLNYNIPARTKKEYYQDNSEYFSLLNRDRRLNNLDKFKEKDKIYYDNNKDKILQKQNEKYNCDCGGFYTRCNKAIHFKTKKHQEYLKGSIPEQDTT